MTAAWPATVPQAADINSYNEEDQDTILEDKAEIGPPKRRARTTMVIPMMSYDKVMTWAQWDFLQTFYRVTVKRGTLPFTRTHPRTGVAITAIFTARPKATSIDNSFCRVQISLTQLPVNAA